MARERQKARSEKLREAILDTAMDIALKDGMDAISIRRLSGAMGYSTGVIYYHFADKQAILDAIQAREGAVLRGNVEAALRADMSAAEKLRAAFHAVLLMAHGNADRYNLVVRSRHGRGEPDRAEMVGWLCGHLQEGVARGEFYIQDIPRTAFSVWSSFLGFHMAISQRRDLTLEEAEARFDVQYRLILAGLTRPGGRDF